MAQRAWWAAVVVVAVGCGGGVPGGGEDAGVDAGPMVEADAGPMVEPDAGPVDAGPPPNEYQPASADWCQRFAPATASSDAPEVQLAKAHAAVRYFAVPPSMGNFERFDDALVAALEGSLATPDLKTYANALGEVCVVPVAAQPLGAARVTLRGELAWVVPGTGTLAIPAEAKALVLDLRGLPDAPGLEAALRAATTATLSSPLVRFTQPRRTYEGHPDTWYLDLAGLPADFDVYASAVTPRAGAPWPGTAATALPMVVVTSPTLPPLAAELALSLRLGSRAGLVGHDVPSRVAESVTYPAGAHGLALRLGRFDRAGSPVSDVVPADVGSDTPERVLRTVAEVVAMNALGFPTAGAVTRADTRELKPSLHRPAKALSRAQTAAALLVAFGTAHRFFPIYDTWNPSVDARLVELVRALPQSFTRRVESKRLLERFSNSLADGHVYVTDLRGDATSWNEVAIAALDFELVNGAPVVKFSGETGVLVGDVVTSVDGEPIATFLARERGYVSAATPLTGLMVTANRLAYLPASGRSFGLQTGTQAPRTVQVMPRAMAPSPPFGPQRASGWLTDLGASNVYYLNLSGYSAAPETEAQLLAHLDAAQNAKGLVVDCRGYPGVDLRVVNARIVGRSYPSARFRSPLWWSPFDTELDLVQYTWPAQGVPVTAKVALLGGPATQSAGETLMLELLQRPGVEVFGRQTSGSNGNITTVALPGGFGMAFTGMQVRFADDRPFAGIGLLPTRPSAPSVEDVAQGIDRELTDASAWLKALP